ARRPVGVGVSYSTAWFSAYHNIWVESTNLCLGIELPLKKLRCRAVLRRGSWGELLPGMGGTDVCRQDGAGPLANLAIPWYPPRGGHICPQGDVEWLKSITF